MSFFHLQKSLEIFAKNSAEKILIQKGQRLESALTSEITTSLNSRKNVAITIFQSFFLELYMPTYQYQV